MSRCPNSKSNNSRSSSKDATNEQLATKFRLVLATLLLILAFSINSYLAFKASLPAPIDYGAVYDSLHQQ